MKTRDVVALVFVLALVAGGRAARTELRAELPSSTTTAAKAQGTGTDDPFGQTFVGLK